MAIFSTTGSDTYPAGHVIQTIRNQANGDGINITSTSYVRADSMYASIHNVLASSHVLVHTTFDAEISSNDTADGASFAIFRGSSNEYSHSAGHQVYVGNGQHNWYVLQTIVYLDTSPGTGQNDYYLGRRVYSSANVRIDASQPFTMCLQEIQQ